MSFKRDADGNLVQDDAGNFILLDDSVEGGERSIDEKKLPGLFIALSKANQKTNSQLSEIKELQEQLAAYSSLGTVSEIPEIKTKLRTLEENALADTDGIDELRKSWAEEEAKIRNELLSAKDAEITELAQQLQQSTEQLQTYIKSSMLAESKFIRDELSITPDLFESHFGKSLKVEADPSDPSQFKVLYYRDGNLMYSKTDPTQPMTGDEALRDIINRYAHKDQILVSGSPGPGGINGTNVGGNSGPQTLTDKLAACFAEARNKR